MEKLISGAGHKACYILAMFQAHCDTLKLACIQQLRCRRIRLDFWYVKELYCEVSTYLTMALSPFRKAHQKKAANPLIPGRTVT